MATANIVERIKKLRKLAASPNCHEADSAALEATRLMVQHGVSEDDVSDTVFQVVDSRTDEYREFVAILASKLYKCSVALNRSGEIAFRGLPRSVRHASSFYQFAVESWQRSQMPPIADWAQAPSRKIYDFFWWDGFAQAVYERFPVQHEPIPAVHGASAPENAPQIVRDTARLRPESPVTQEPDLVEGPRRRTEPLPTRSSVIEMAKDGAREVAPYLSIPWLQDSAHRHGRAAAEQVLGRVAHEDAALSLAERGS